MTFKMITSSKQKRNYLNVTTITDCLSSFGGVLLLLFVCISSAQADPLIKIADDVVSQTAVGVPTAKNKPNPTRYNLWMYQNFMIMEGMDALGEVTGNESYKNYTKRSIDFFAAYQSKFGDSMKAGPAGTGKWYTKPRQLWQTGMVATFAEHHKMRPNPEFVRGMKTYMIAPYWCRKAELLEDSKWLDRAIEETLHYFDYLWDQEDKLMNPLWLQKRKGPYGLYWGRGNGWYIMAITDLLTFIPQDHPKRKEVLNDYRSFINGIIARQGEEGMWYQILDKSDSYQETSCSGMFTYCILKGINEGWLDDSYFPAAKKGWHGLLSVVNENNELTGVCPPSDISEDPNYYLIGRAPRVHDQHGIGPFLLAGTAYLQANKKLMK